MMNTEVKAAQYTEKYSSSSFNSSKNRSEEHTSELQSRFDLVCRLLLEKKKKIILLQCMKTFTTYKVCHIN